MEEHEFQRAENRGRARILEGRKSWKSTNFRGAENRGKFYLLTIQKIVEEHELFCSLVFKKIIIINF